MDEIQLDGNILITLSPRLNIATIGFKQPTERYFKRTPISFSFEDEYFTFQFDGIIDHRHFNFCLAAISIPIHILKISSFCDFLDQISFFKWVPIETLNEVLKNFPTVGTTKTQQYKINEHLILENFYECREIRLNPGDEFIDLEQHLILKSNGLILGKFVFNNQITYTNQFFSFKQLSLALRQLISPEKTPFTEKDLTHTNSLRRNLAKLAYQNKLDVCSTI